jgi:hypothetical protein
MATADDIDPGQAARRANDQLRAAINQLDEHIQALAAPTMELALAQRKRVAESGLEELEPSALIRKFVSQAGPGAAIGASEPGQLNPDASVSDAAMKEGWERFFSGATGKPGAPGAPPGMAPGGGSAIAGKTNVEAERIAAQGFTIPQFGDWQLDSLLRMAAHTSGQVAMRKYKSQAENEFEETGQALSPEEWQKTQGRFASSNLAQKFETGATRVAEASLIHKKVLSPLLDIGFGASNAGASLGYSPQGEGLGGGFLGASHYFGIPNPLAAITSPAGKQGLGTVANAAEAAIGGSGIGLGEANSLRQALGSQGWSNQRNSSLLGLTMGGEQETLALAMEPLMKKGFKNPEVLAEFTSALKLGSGNIGELTTGIEQLAETAKMTHQTLEAEAVKAQEFMAKSVEGGSTMIHGLTAYGEIAKATKMNPLLVQGINEGQFGQVQALSKGIMPWEIQGMSGNAAALNAWETVKKVSGYVPKQSDTRNLNKVTGKWEVTETAAEKEGGYIHMLEPSITAEQAKRLKEIGPKLEAVQGGFGEANTIQQHRYAMEQTNEKSKDGAALLKARNEWSATQTRVNELKNKLSKMPSGDLFSSQESKYGDVRGELEEEEGRLHDRHSAYTNAMSKASKAGKLNAGQQGLLRSELEGPKGLYATAASAGINPEELAKIKKEGVTHQAGDIYKALEKLNKVNIEKQNEENAKIELAGPAKSFFKLKFPAASAKSESNEGGPAMGSKAASPNAAGETASEQSAVRQAEQASRAEPTTTGG